MPRRHRERGFTLLELLVVVLVLGVLAAIAIPRLTSSTGRSRDTVAQANLRSALSVATSLGVETADATALSAAEPALRFVASPAVADEPGELSVTVSGATWGAAARSASGTCFVIRRTTTGATTYGRTTPESCHGATALTATGTDFTALTTLPCGSSLTAWFDATATETVTTTTTWTEVAAWAGRVGPTATAPSEAARPTLTTVDGRPYLTFDGANDRLHLDLPGAKATVFAVVRSTRPNDWAGYGSTLETRTGVSRIGNFFQAGQPSFAPPYPAAVRRNGTPLTAPFSLAPVDTHMVLTVNPSDPTNSNHLSIGALENAYFSTIQLGELIVCSSVLSTTDTQAVETYLRAKWGI